jgi:hypothetical protein
MNTVFLKRIMKEKNQRKESKTKEEIINGIL